MKKPTRKQIILILIAILIAAAVVYGFLPDARSVETATVRSASMQVTVEEEGKTQVKENYTVYSPITAFIHRVDLEPGDTVEAGQTIIELGPPPSSLLDPRAHAEATARAEAAEASLEQAETQAEQAITERGRIERLAGAGSATRQQLDQAQTEANRAIAALNAAQAELAAARAAAASATGNDFGPELFRALQAPASGRILAVHRESEGLVNAGEPLVEIGNIDSLEIQVDVLSQDAVRISPGMRVVLEQWGRDSTLEASVVRVESHGREEVSALGVEEQRVRVIAEFDSPPEMWNRLGTGYRVLAKFIIWEDDNVLQVPASALFRTGGNWAAFVVEDGTARRRTVTVGHQSGLAAQILEGLSEGDEVIIHPDDSIEDGVEVEAE